MSTVRSESSALHARLLLLLAPLTVLLTGCGGPNLFDRLQQPRWGLCGTLIIVLDIVALVDLLGGDDDRSFASTVIWALLIIFAPVLGVILYFLFGR